MDLMQLDRSDPPQTNTRSSTTRRNPVLFVLAFLLAAAEARADLQENPAYWAVFTAQDDLGVIDPKLDKLLWWFDGQARFVGDDPEFFQGLVRPAVGYAIAPGWSVWLGYAWFRTSPPGADDFDENRIWEQLSWSNTFEPVRVASRTRLEQQFFQDIGDDTGHRFRQRFDVFYPADSRLYMTLNEEVFFDLVDTDYGAEAGFSQNWLFVGPGYAIDEKRRFTVEVGYFNQYIRVPRRDDVMNHTLFVALHFRP